MKGDFYDDAKVTDFRRDQIVHIHPGCDAWMQGDMDGKVTSINKKRGIVYVRMRRSDRLLAFAPCNLAKELH